MSTKFILGLATVLGVGLGANGTFMLVAPLDWYFAIPGVTTTGPFNQHFLRDIGLIFLLVSAAYLTGVMLSRHRVILWGAASLWLGGHALFHFWEVAVGICGPSVLLRDFPAVTTPAVIGGLLTVWAVVREGRADV
ncbi:hypothetical protein P7B02_11730 [Caulobacter segnis]|uniref:hypothetical protein n=1 Tax=Caulobacter segnis TaxID=88688 RepID=UPI00240FBEAC|nr:hypothetical protein [Caulobacter segnis]MDG2522211.1 hypothetical protein [Caulobacter segnis]